MEKLVGNDADFGPQYLGPGDSRLDFTLKFLEIIFGILPAVSFIVLAALLIAFYRQRPACVAPAPLLWSKQSAAALLSCVEIAHAALWGTSPKLRTGTSLPSAVLSCVAAIAIAFAITYGHRHNLRSPAFLGIFLAISVLFDIIKSRSYFLRPGYHVFGYVSVASGAVKLVLLALEEIPKTSRFVPGPHATVGAEAKSGYWNRALFIWLNKTLVRGFRKVLTVDELEDLGVEFASEHLVSVFLQQWNKTNRTNKYCLILASVLALLAPCLIITIPRLLFSGFLFSQPFLLRRMMEYVGQVDSSEPVGQSLVSATVAIFIGIALSRASYKHMSCRFSVRLRGALISAIFHKALALRAEQAERSEAMTLMSTDVEGIVTGATLFYDVCAAVIELIFGLYFLSTVVGKAAILSIFPIAFSTVAATIIGDKMGSARATWNKFIETRVAKTAAALKNIKGIKMLGLEPMMMDFIQQLRVQEVESSKQCRILTAVISVIAMFSYAITPVIVITGALFWTTFKGKLNAVDTFTTLAFILLIQVPLVILLKAYPSFTATLASFQRIQNYLLLEEKHDTRLRTNETESQLPEQLEKGDPTNEGGSKTLSTAGDCVIKFSNVTISRNSGGKLLLNRSNFSITRCQLVMVAGSVGCGKSTLLEAILGEVSPTDGSIYVEKGVVAYCAQVPWLRNLSIRDNITGDSPDSFDSVWYREVLSGCLLVEDLSRLPGGDQYKVGSGGVNLSGGQRHRVALARALYSRAPIIVLDDILSALDQPTGTAILSQLFGQSGLVRRCLSTVVMATHSVSCLREANKILFLHGQGNIVTFSNTDGLLQHECFQDLSDEQTTSYNSSDGEKSDSVQPALTAPECDHIPLPKSENGYSESEILKGDMTLYRFYLKSIGKFSCILWALVMLLLAATERLSEIYVRIWLDVDPDDIRFFIGYAFLGVSSSLFVALNHMLYYLHLVPKSCTNLHEMLLEATTRATLSFLAETDTGSLLNRFSQDMTLLSQNLPAALFRFLYMLCIVMIDIAIIATTAKYAAITIPFLLVALYAIQKFYLRTSRQMRHLDLEAKTPLYTQFSETSFGLHHIRSFCWIDDCLRQCYKVLDHSQKPFYYMYCIQQWLALALDGCSLVISTVLALIAVNYKDSTTQAAIGLGFINMITFSLGMGMLIENWVDLETCLGAIARLRTFMKTTPVESGPDPDSTHLNALWPEHGEIDINNLSASYKVGSNQHKALENVSVNIRGGIKVGIVGRTGSGKSTMLLALLNFLDYSGSMTIDGVEVSQVPLQRLRSRITTITQDYVELHGSVRNNLLPYEANSSESITDDIVVDALKKFGLWERVSSSGGLNAEMATLGLSQGEKQLLYITRAFLHHRKTRSKVILIDEATSNMDRETDQNVQLLMKENFKGSTILMVAHRHDTIKDADMVIELANGRIVTEN